MFICTLLCDISCHMHHDIFIRLWTLEKCNDIGGALLNLYKWHLRPFLKLFKQMHKLRGSSTISLDLNDFIEYLVSFNCVVINHQKGEDCKCIWPPKCLMFMTYTIKELMSSLSYKQYQQSLKWKRAIKDAIFAKETVYELHWRSFAIFYFEFECRKHRTTKRDVEK